MMTRLTLMMITVIFGVSGLYLPPDFVPFKQETQAGFLQFKSNAKDEDSDVIRSELGPLAVGEGQFSPNVFDLREPLRQVDLQDQFLDDEQNQGDDLAVFPPLYKNLYPNVISDQLYRKKYQQKQSETPNGNPFLSLANRQENQQRPQSDMSDNRLTDEEMSLLADLKPFLLNPRGAMEAGQQATFQSDDNNNENMDGDQYGPLFLKAAEEDEDQEGDQNPLFMDKIVVERPLLMENDAAEEDFDDDMEDRLSPYDMLRLFSNAMKRVDVKKPGPRFFKSIKSSANPKWTPAPESVKDGASSEYNEKSIRVESTD